MKKIGDKVENVDLRRLFLDPTVKKLQESRYVTHELYMTEDELRKMEGKWDNVDEVIQKLVSSRMYSSTFPYRSYIL